MKKKVKLFVGQKINRWEILEISKNKEIIKCQCSCEKKTIVELKYNSLVKNINKSCGCLQRENTRLKCFKDLTGKTFGRWTVLRIDINKIKPNNNRKTYYICQCVCGSPEKSVEGPQLTNGTSQSCGCYKKEQQAKACILDLTNKRFGILTVIKMVGSNRQNKAMWYCKCDCGGERTTCSNSLVQGMSTSCGCLSESIIATELKKYCIENFLAETECFLFRNPENNHKLYYDIYIPKFKLVIEVHGSQHYRFSKRWHVTQDGFKHRQYLDSIKKEYAENNGLYLEINLLKTKKIEQAIQIVDDYINNLQKSK